MKTINTTLLIGLLVTALILPACTTPSWAEEAEKIAQVALPIVEGITSIVGAGPAVAKVETDVNALITLFETYQATPATGTLQQIQAGLSAANADIAQIMPGVGIKNSATQNKLAAVLQLVASEFSNMASLVPANGSEPAASSGPTQAGAGQRTPGSATATPPPLTAKEFKVQYNRLVKTRTGDAECDRVFAGKELK
jgi:hypothetical protein